MFGEAPKKQDRGRPSGSSNQATILEWGVRRSYVVVCMVCMVCVLVFSALSVDIFAKQTYVAQSHSCGSGCSPIQSELTRLHASKSNQIRNSSCSGLPPVIPESELALKRHFGGMHFDEIWLCDPLRLAYIHIFKSGGSSLGKMLHEACRNIPEIPSKDASVRILSGWTGNTQFSRYNVTKLCAEFTCYSAHRDPLERFLSGYHELRKRNKWDPDAEVSKLHPEDESIRRQHLSKFIVEVVDGKYHNAHIQPQAFFFGDKNHSFRMNSIHWAPLEDAYSLLNLLFCAKYAIYGCGGRCELNVDGTHFKARSRKLVKGYGIEEFTFDVSDLSEEETLALEKYYAVDFCLFHRQPTSPLDCFHTFA